LMRLRDKADGPRRDAGIAAHALGEAELIAGSHRDRRLLHDAAARDADIVEARRLERAGEDHRLLDAEAAFEPVGAGDARPHWALRRPSLAHRRSDAQRQPHAVFQAPAIDVSAA